MRNKKGLKLAAFLLAIVLIFNGGIGVFAYDSNTPPEEIVTENTDHDIVKFDSSLYEDLKEGVDYVENEIIFEYKTEVSSETPDAVETELKETYDLEEINSMGIEDDTAEATLHNSINEESVQETAYIAKCEGDVIETIEAMNEDDNILYAEPNYYLDTCDVDDWPLDSENYGAESSVQSLALTAGGYLDETEEKSYQISQIDMFNSMGLNMVWNAYTGVGTVIAVIDSGVDFTHPTLQGTNWQKNGDADICGYDAAQKSEININNVSVTDSHGSMVAGVIAMQMDTEAGYKCRGLAPDAKIMSCKADDENGKISVANLCRGIEYAVANEADIINISLGTTTYSNQLSDTCARAARKAVIVSAAGNDGEDISENCSYPAALSSVIGVMAYGGSSCAGDYTGTVTTNKELLEHNYPGQLQQHYLAEFSNADTTSKFYNIAAPGVNICCPDIGGTGSVSGYTYVDGTSFSSPVVASVVALYLQKHASKNVTPAQVRKAIQVTDSNATRSYNALISGEDDGLQYNRIMPTKMLRTSVGEPDASVKNAYVPTGTGDYTNFNTFVRNYLCMSASEDITADDLSLIDSITIDSSLAAQNIIGQLDELSSLAVINSIGYNVWPVWNEIIQNNFSRLYLIDLENCNLPELLTTESFAPNLVKLHIYNSKLMDISGIENFRNLTYAYLKSNFIRDLDMIGACDRLAYLCVSNNCINTISWCSDCSAETIDIRKNNLRQFEDQILSDVRERNINILTKPYNDQYVPSASYELKEKTVNRTSLNAKIDFEMYPVNSTVYEASWSINNPGAVKIDKYSGEVQIDQNLAATQITQNTDYTVTSTTYDGVTDSTTLHVIVPEIQNLNLEHFTINNTDTYKFQVKTSLDTTKLKIQQTYTENQEEQTVVSEITSGYADRGHVRYWTIPYAEPVHENSVFTVTPGDSIGYMSPSAVNDKVDVVINNDILTSVSGSADTLNLSGFNELSISDNAFTSNTEIDHVTIDSYKLTISANAFNGAVSVGNVALFCNTYISSIAANAFVNCNALTLYTTMDVSLPVNVVDDFIVNNGVLTAYTGSGTNVVIPDVLHVTEIGANAFSNNVAVLSVVWGDSVKKIGESAFEGCTNLTTVSSFENIEEIGNNAFKNSGLNMYVKFSDKFYSVGVSAFENSHITGLYIPSDTVNWFIMDAAFRNCDNLTHITLRDCKNYYELNKYVFQDCTNLEEVYFPRLIESVNNFTFEKCSNLLRVNLPDRVRQFKPSAFASCGKLEIDRFPESLSLIDSNAFNGCRGLGDEIILFKNISTIKNASFANCNIKNVYIIKNYSESEYDSKVNLYDGAFNSNVMVYANPGAVNIVESSGSNYITLNEDYSFEINNSGNVWLTSYNGTGTSVCIPEAMSVYEIDVEAFKDKTTITDITIPDTVFYINSSAFSGCTNLTRVYGMAGVYFIADSCFENCISLKEIDLSRSVTYYVLPYAFSGCSSLESAKLSYNCHIVFFNCFENCTALKTVVIPNVSAIYNRTFANCSSLQTVVLPGDVSYINSNAFVGCDMTKIDFYSNSAYVKNFVHEKDGVVFSSSFSIENGAFTAYEGNDSVFKIPEAMGITSIEENAFNSTELKGIIIPDCITCISGNTFNACTNLTEVLIYGNINLDGNPFFTNSDVAIYTNGYNVTGTLASNITLINGFIISDYIIQSYTGTDTAPRFPANMLIHTIAASAFRGNESITSVTIPEGIEEINNFAFQDCSKLASVTLPDSLTYLGGRMFYNCTSLTSVNFGSGNARINREAFMNCTSLTSIELPENINLIASSTFKNCTNLTNVYILNPTMSIGIYAFLNCSEALAIHCYENSTAHTFAVDNSIQYILLTQGGETDE